MDNTNYALALREAYNEKASLMNEFSSEQARKEAITNVTGEVDIPSGIALVQSSIKSDAGKAILKNFLKKTTGIDEETASDFIDNVAENGLHGLMNSDIATQIKDRASEFLNPSDGESTILKLRNLFMNGKEEGLDALTKIAPNNLSELKQRVYDEGKERLESLRTEKNNKVSELKNKIKDLQEQAENETDNDRLSEIENNINDLKQQGRDIVSKYKDELSDNKAELENRMNDIQDSINKKADDLVNDFNDSIESLKNNVGERFSNINNTVSKYIGKRKLEINPTENYEEGDENLIGNIKNFFSNLISKGKDTVKPLVEQKYEMAMELRDKVNNIKIPRDLEDQINETQSQLDNISDQYRNITTSEEQADIINNMRDLQDKLDDLQDKKNDLIDKATYKIKNKLQKKYNLREEEEDDDIYEGMEPHEIEATFREQLQNEPNIDELVSSSGNRYMSLLQNPEQIMGQDSSIARAIN